MTVPGNLSSPLLATAAAADTAANITKSLRFNDGDSAYLSKTPSSAGNRKKFTFSAWLKKGKTSGNTTIFSAGSDGSNRSHILLNDTNHTLRYFNINSGSLNANVASSAFLRDHSAWYHIVIAVDTSQSTASDRIKIYLNGVEITSFSSSTYPSQNDDLQQNATVAHNIGKGISNAEHFDGYLADVYFIDGSQLEPTSFGAFDDNGVWQAIGYSGTFGTNGFHLLDFANESTVGHDSSGNENDFTANNISTTAGAGNDVLFDVPTNSNTSDTGVGGEVSANYATFNPLNGSTYTFSNGNLEATGYGATNQMTSTFGVSSGKWYAEFTVTGSGGTSNCGIGISKGEEGYYPGQQSGSAGYFGSGSKIVGGAVSSYGASFTYNDIIGVALDMDAGTCTMYKNNSSQGQIISGLSGTYFIAIRNSSSTGDKIIANFGARSFSYTAPSGYKAWNTASLPTPTIADGRDYFDAKLWTGNATARSITGYNFSPDFAWIKDRAGTDYHSLIDIVRGGTKVVFSNVNIAEETQSQAITSFNSDGFSLGTWNAVNKNSGSFVGFAWDGGSSTASNTDGTITSSVRANATAGFSIVAYSGNSTSGATIGHGLNAAPEFVVVKARNIGTQGWCVYHASLGATKYIQMDTTNAASTYSGTWNNTSPTNSVFTVGNDNIVNTGYNYVAYCFTPVAGYSAFGSYTGNGSSDGPFVYTGFRPAIIIQKRTDSSGSWTLVDTARDIDNPAALELLPNSNAAEYDNTSLFDILSNGFKVRATFNNLNASSGSFIYLAFAENPFQANGGLAR